MNEPGGQNNHGEVVDRYAEEDRKRMEFLNNYDKRSARDPQGRLCPGRPVKYRLRQQGTQP